MSYVRKHDRTRPRSWFSLFIRMGGWSCFIFGLFLFIFSMISAGQLMIADQLDREGRFTTAVVMDKLISVTTDSDGDEETEYLVTFRYKAQGGGREIQRDTDSDFFHQVSLDDEVPVRYLDDDPTVIEYNIGEYRRGGVAVRWISLIIGIAGLYALWRFGSEANAMILARRDGEKRLAQVTGILETGVEVNDRHQARLTWRESDGRTGKSLMHDRAKLSRLYHAGDEVVVFRLGDQAFWEGDVGPPKREMTES